MRQKTLSQAFLGFDLRMLCHSIGEIAAGAIMLGMTLLPAAAQNAPTTTTLSATSITTTSATLRETINPNGRVTHGWFEWGTTGDYGNTTPRSAFGGGTSPVTMTRGLTGLMPGTPYHFRAVGSNVLGVTYGVDQTFTTVAIPPPIVTTLAATDITPTAATLHESINPNSLPTQGWFQWGTTTNYGNDTPPDAFGSGSTPVTVSRGLADLTPGTIYHFRAVGSNLLGLVYGEDLSFTAPAIPPRLVTTLADTGPGSLRQTIAEAVSGDKILIVTNGTITNFSGTLVLNKILTIVGNGPTNTAISGNRAYRVFTVTAGATVNLMDLTIRDGKTSNGTPGPNHQTAGSNGGSGGGILNAGSLLLSNCVVTFCATGMGGAGYNSATNNPNLGYPGGVGGNGGDGAGIHNIGNLALIACTLSRHTNGVGGAGGRGSAQTTNSPAAAGGAGGCGGKGSGLFNAGTVTLTRCVFELNFAGVGGGGGKGGWASMSTSSIGGLGGHGGAGGDGGAVASSAPVAATNCLHRYNYAGQGGSGGQGGTGGGIFRTFGNGGAGGSGGPGGSGGGICCAEDVVLHCCTFIGNSAGRGGLGGVGGWPDSTFGSYPYPGDGGTGGNGGGGGDGGGACSSGFVWLVTCTLGWNLAGTGGNGGGGGSGGGSSTDVEWPGGDGGDGGVGGQGGKGGGVFSGNGMYAVASTFLKNVAGLGGYGGEGGYGGPSIRGRGGNGGDGGVGGAGGSAGGILAGESTERVSLCNTLIADNRDNSGGPGGVAGVGAPKMHPSYPGGNDGNRGAYGAYGSADDLMGIFTSEGHNLIGLVTGSTGFTNGVNGDLVGTTTPLDSQLEPCGDNGGDIPTCALRPGSPAVNAGDDSILDPPVGLTMDQRGRPRRSGGHVDIGAYELQVAAGDIQVTGFGRPSSGSTQVRFVGESGVSYTVLMTTNCGLPMSIWSSVGSPTETVPGQFEFTDTTATNKAQRFYRVRSP